MRNEKEKILIIGSGLAGLSAALECALRSKECVLVSSAPAQRAQSVMAEGGINAALDTKGESDSPEEHFQDTMKAGCFLADGEAVRGMTEAAPGIVKSLKDMGVCFNLDKNGDPDLRNFGGQKKKRTAFAKSDTGKQIMTALTDEVRKYEASGLVTRLMNHSFETLTFTTPDRQICAGCLIRDDYTGEILSFKSPAVIIATGGMHGLFGNTTGSRLNTGEAVAELYRLGAEIINPEFIQYHPTTVSSGGKRMLISEAARGEGGRLFAMKETGKWYFMEEKYPELGNLMPRDITAREIWHAGKKYPVFLDMTHLPDDIMENKLSGIVEDCITYLNLDPRKEPVPVEPGIHYFMGGLNADRQHMTNIHGLFAAGECCGLYHGANRLGGNSLLGAIYGGRVAGENACKYSEESTFASGSAHIYDDLSGKCAISDADRELLQRTLGKCMGVVRNEKELQAGLDIIRGLDGDLARLGEAMCSAALERRESRGAHFREDHPDIREEFCKSTVLRR